MNIKNRGERFVLEIVEHLNLQFLKESYAGRGSQPYNPEMLVALLFYGYATGVFSSRRLERSTYDWIAFRYIAANTHPNHDTIATFRKRFLPHLTALFTEILKIGHQLGVLKLGAVSLDGSKVKANASTHKALSYGHASKLEAQIEAEVAELLIKAEAADKADIPDGMEIPEELSRRTERLKAIKEAKSEIERHISEQKAYEDTCTKRAQKEHETGKKPRGKGPTDKDQVNLYAARCGVGVGRMEPCMHRMEPQKASCSGCIRGKEKGLLNLQGQVEAKEWPVTAGLAIELTINTKIDRKRSAG